MVVWRRTRALNLRTGQCLPAGRRAACFIEAAAHEGCQAEPFGFAQGKRLALDRAWHYCPCCTENVARLFRGEVLAHKSLGSEDPSYMTPAQILGDTLPI